MIKKVVVVKVVDISSLGEKPVGVGVNRCVGWLGGYLGLLCG